MKKRLKILLPAVLTLPALTIWALWPGLTVQTYQIRTAKLAGPVRLVLLTDLHGTLHGEGQERLLSVLQAQKPDAVLLSGDIADDHVPIEGARVLLAAIGEKYPCYYVTGNHEIWSGRTEDIKALFRSYGVTVLEGTGARLAVGEESIFLCGVDDPEAFETIFDQEISPGWREQLAACRALTDGKTFSVLLSHRPERVEDYRSSGFDLVAAGHAHGGQVRIPGLLNGLLAPHQGLFPKYAGGLYDLGGVSLVVSRGLSVNPKLPRVFNPPEVVVIDILPA